jgi:GNAT superfamily N-acetyltransferase
MDERIDPPSSIHSMTASDFVRKATSETLITASLDGSLVGCLFCRSTGEWLYVGKMAVAANLQRSGVGRLMIDQARQLARNQGLLGLELETRIELTENHDAFGRLGFVVVAQEAHEGYSRMTSVRMRSPLQT